MVRPASTPVESTVTRAWKKSEEHLPRKDMHLFTIKEDGTELRQVTSGAGTHWSPFPAPDGVQVVYVKLLPPRNFELFLLNLMTGEERQLTDHPSFDGFPSISPDGKLLAFSSSREAKPGTRSIGLFLMDVSSLQLGRKSPAGL
jgi:Tol biopolymer transport system component